jgi:trypsin
MAGLACFAIQTVHARAWAITYGKADGEDLGVVALLSGGSFPCTGTMVSDRLVLTAGHCFDLSRDPSRYQVAFGADSRRPLVRDGVTEIWIDPAYDPGSLQGDAALVLLAEEAPAGAAPWPLAPRSLDGAEGATLRLVGYGLTDDPDEPVGIKREGTARLTSLESWSFVLEASPSQTCNGDSGGPAFLEIDGQEALVGITSSGDPACAGYGRDTRLDVTLPLFVRPLIDATAPGTARTGQRCWFDANCVAGSCLTARSDPSVRYCSVECRDGRDCPGAMACTETTEGSRCTYPDASPGAFGAPCSLDDDCESGLCAQRGFGDYSCSLRCFPENEPACPGDQLCLPSADDFGRYACFEPPHRLQGGCAAGGPTGRGPSAAEALVVLTLVAWSRRRSVRAR